MKSLQMLLNVISTEPHFHTFPQYVPYRTQVDHAVVAVGWGTSKDAMGNDLPYWILRNSWGTMWGEAGYFKVRRGGHCEVAKV